MRNAVTGIKRVSVIGHFADGLQYLNGQTVKTKILTNALCREYGMEEVHQFDTHGGWKVLLRAPVYMLQALRKSKNVIILPSDNGLYVFGVGMPLLRHFFKERYIHYVVIGGWLPEMLKTKVWLADVLKKFDGIYVETNMMKQALELQGFENVYVMPNCKELEPLSECEPVHCNESPYRLCTFSRVMKEKGIEDAVEAVKRVNRQFGKTIYTLDIYGQVDSAQTEWFDRLKRGFPDYITYAGCVPFDKSVDTLKSYFAILFPTYYHGEGFAGTILDAMAAGVPIIASDWKYNKEIIGEEAGYFFEPRNVDELVIVLKNIISDVEQLNGKKAACIKKSDEYTAKKVFRILFDRIR